MNEPPTQPQPSEKGLPKPTAIGETIAAVAPSPADTGPPEDRPAAGPAPIPVELRDHPKYRVIALIGQGGMGAVYKAEHRRMERIVALKVINPAFMHHASAVLRFQQEVKAAARLHHAHIVASHDADQAGALHFLVMEYVEGRSLAEHLQEKGPLPFHEACDYARQAALGLQHAHEHGLVHRDIKPHNLMRTPEGQVKILDFGLARLGLEAEARGPATAEGSATESLTTVGAVMGTADYMAPEQASDSHTADIRADVYSLGCTLYHLLTGSVPFPGGTLLEKLARHKTEQLPEPGRHRRDLPAGLAPLLRKMTAKAPADRFATPGHLAHALTAFAAPPRQRRPRRLAVLGLITLVLLALGVVFVALQGSPSPKPPGPRANPQPKALVEPGAPSPADALTRDAIPPEALTWAARGDPTGAPAELVAVLGETRLRYYGMPAFPTYSPDGKTLAIPSGSDILLFDASTGQLLRTLLGHTMRVYRTAFSLDGKTLASISFDGKAILWDAATGREKDRLPIPGQANGWDMGLAFVPNTSDAWLAGSGVSGNVWAWNLTTHNLRTFSGAQGIIGCLAVNSAGSLLAAGSENGVVYVWDFATGQLLKSLAVPRAGAAAEHIAVAFSPNGELLAAGNETTLNVWDAAAFKIVWSKSATGAGLTAFTPDGATLLTAHGDHESGTPRVLQRWRAADGMEGDPVSLPSTATSEWIHWALRPDGKEAAAVGYSERVATLCDLETGQLRWPVTGHGADVRSIAFSPDGATLASAADDGLVKLWDLAVGKELHSLAGHEGPVRCVAFSPDGALLASGGVDGIVRLWDPAGGPALHVCKRYAGRTESVAFHPSGRTLASCNGGGTVQFWNADSGEPVGAPLDLGSTLQGVAFRPDGGALAAAGDGQLITLWDPDTHRKISTASDPSWLAKAAFFPDGGPLALVGGDGKVKLRDPATAEIQRTLPATAAAALGKISVRPDGRMIAASGQDGCLRLWDLGADPPRRKVIQLAPMGYWLDAVAFSPDGRYLAVGCPEGLIYLFRLAPAGKLPVLPDGEGSFREERVLPGHSHEWVANVAFEADGRHVLTADFADKVRRWDGDGDAAPEVFDGCPNAARAAAFTADGRMFAGCRDGKVRLWDFRAGKEIYFGDGHAGEVSASALSADGKFAVTGGDDGKGRLWLASSGKALKVLTGHTAAVRSIAVSADGGRALTGSLDGTARLWDTASAVCLRVFTGYQGMHPHGLCLSADGKRAAYGGADGLVHVWDLEHDEERLRLPFADGYVRGIAFSPDGKRLLAGGDKGLLAMWDAETGRVLDLTRTAPTITLAFSPDGRRAVTGHADKTARVWRLPEVGNGP